MTQLSFGVHCVFGEGPGVERTARVADLLCDERWPWRFSLLHVRPVPGEDAPPPSTQRLSKQPLAEVHAALAAPSTLRIGLAMSRRESDNHAWIYVDTGRARYPDGAYPNDLRAICRMPSSDSPVPLAAWLDLMHDLVTTLGATHGVVIASDHEAALRCNVWLQNESHEGRDVHPDPTMISALAVRRHALGDRWVRPPEWGTYLSAGHVAAVGGRDRIVEVVQPPIVRELGSLLYVQLSRQPGDALSADTEARRRAFAGLLAPITVPR